MASYVEFYNESDYLSHSSIQENIIFGAPVGDRYNSENLVKDPGFLGVLESCNLKTPLLEAGADLISQTVSILGDVPADEMFFSQTPILASEYENAVELSSELTAENRRYLEQERQNYILKVALRYIPADHKILRLQPHLKEAVLAGRKEFRRWCTENDPEGVIFHSDAEYIRSQSILNNIFYGNLTTSSPKVDDRVNQCIVFLLIEEDAG